MQGAPRRCAVRRERFLSRTFVGADTLYLAVVADNSTHASLFARALCRSCRCHSRHASISSEMVPSLLGNMSLRYTSLTIYCTKVKSGDCTVRCWFNIGIGSADSRDKAIDVGGSDLLCHQFAICCSCSLWRYSPAKYTSGSYPASRVQLYISSSELRTRVSDLPLRLLRRTLKAFWALPRLHCRRKDEVVATNVGVTHV